MSSRRYIVRIEYRNLIDISPALINSIGTMSSSTWFTTDGHGGANFYGFEHFNEFCEVVNALTRHQKPFVVYPADDAI